MLSEQTLKKLIRYRHELHAIPEISHKEEKTAAYIKEKLEQTDPDSIIDEIGGHGLVAIYNGTDPENGPVLMIRAELDALAIEEQNEVSYKSEHTGRMHACGHDGHMAIVLGVAEWLRDHRPEKGKVMLLFQPAEETGEGAERMLSDPKFKEFHFDRGFALHNLPGYKKNTVYIRSKTFALASVGIKITLSGKSSHAAFPEEGINPSAALAELVNKLCEIQKKLSSSDDTRVLTITYLKVGEPAFGINPGQGEAGVTIRAETDDKAKQLYERVVKTIEEINNRFECEITHEESEPFAATVNDEDGVEKLKQVAKKQSINIEELDEPIRWSEDFGSFRKNGPITLFGLGAGEKHETLHSETYDFNDDLIACGAKTFCEWIKSELNEG
ncbi:amidohydrolase [Rhodohalobacter sp. SW132]|uniref:amidohydrolase n=1 Tax=Rhodohalobacter sp. SW132 TaxID=2293433 RepID=UPI000E286337|nr:amidohydrolase [Rhodohalobacter sp. SW132]REL29110.1 amidohydrolase [Rhodohalobacter sp. SW132]